MKNSLEGKNVLVTGAASGIGRASVRLFAEAGAKLIVCDVDESGLREIESELEKKGALFFAERVDVSDRAAMKAFADKVHAQIPALDVLVNNAGVGLSGGLLQTTLEDWDWVLKINLGGVIHGCHFFVPKMVERAAQNPGGAVVNVASILGLHAAAGVIGYSASKFGVVGLSESLRGELQPHGIGVTAICPGMIDTAIISKTKFGTRDPETSRARTQKMFSKRGHAPELVASAIVEAARGGPASAGVRPVAPEAWGIWMLQRLAPSILPRVEQAMRKHGLVD